LKGEEITYQKQYLTHINPVRIYSLFSNSVQIKNTMEFGSNTAVFPDAIDSATRSNAVESGTNFFRAAGHQKALTKFKL
jgi:hypothetical protein